MVTMTIFAIVTSIVYFAYVQALRTLTKGEEAADLGDAVVRAVKTIRADLLRSAYLAQAARDTLAFVTSDGEEIVYALAETLLLRNDAALLPEGISLDTFAFAFYGNDLSFDTDGDSSVTLDELDLDSDDMLKPGEIERVTLVEVYLQASRHDLRRAISSSVYLRSPGRAPATGAADTSELGVGALGESEWWERGQWQQREQRQRQGNGFGAGRPIFQ